MPKATDSQVRSELGLHLVIGNTKVISNTDYSHFGEGGRLKKPHWSEHQRKIKDC